MAIGVAVIGALVLAGIRRHALDRADEKRLRPLRTLPCWRSPFFVLAGNLMNAIGVTQRIFFNLANALVGHFACRTGAGRNVLASVLLAGGHRGRDGRYRWGLGAVENPGPCGKRATARRSRPRSRLSRPLSAPFITALYPACGLCVPCQCSVARMFLAGLVAGD